MADAMAAVALRPSPSRSSSGLLDPDLLSLMLEDVACALRPYGVTARDPQQLRCVLNGLLDSLARADRISSTG